MLGLKKEKERLAGADLGTCLFIVVDSLGGVSTVTIFAFFTGGGAGELSEATLKPISTALALRGNYWGIISNDIWKRREISVP